VSGTHHLQSGTPLSSELVSMSGTNLMIKPLPEGVTESTYSNIINALGFRNISSSDRVKELVAMDSQELLAKIPPWVPLLPTCGGEVGVKTHTFADIYREPSKSLDLPGRNWCSEILIGDCQMDASSAELMSNIMFIADKAVGECSRGPIFTSTRWNKIPIQRISYHIVGLSKQS
jgi:hypothetical protein